jgi:hypothetical protein
MKVQKDENKPSSNNNYTTKDKDLFRTYYFLFVHEIIENKELYAKETRDVKLQTIGSIINLDYETFIAQVVYKDKKINIDLKRVEKIFSYDSNKFYEFYGIFNVIYDLFRLLGKRFI